MTFRGLDRRLSALEGGAGRRREPLSFAALGMIAWGTADAADYFIPPQDREKWEELYRSAGLELSPDDFRP